MINVEQQMLIYQLIGDRTPFKVKRDIFEHPVSTEIALRTVTDRDSLVMNKVHIMLIFKSLGYSCGSC